jgi:purine nucleoside phosphorylase
MTQRITKCIDYTDTFDQFESYSGFCDDVVKSLRQNKPDGEDALVLVIDKGFNLGKSLAVVVSDHLNLTGGSPLTGPNDPVGPRFPVINDVYFVPHSTTLEQGVVAGLKPGIEPTDFEIAQIEKLGAPFFSHNIVQTMLVAAHAGWKVLAILGAASSAQNRERIRELLSNFLNAENLEIETTVSKRRDERAANVS